MASELPSFSSDSDAYLGEEDILLSESHIPCLIEVLVEVSHKWEELGIAIGLPRHVISQCKHDRHIVALNNILHEWVTGNYKGTIPATFKNLKQKLASQIVGEGHVAHKLTVEISTSQLPVSCPEKRQCVRTHSDTITPEAEHLRKMYSKQREVPRSTWPPVGTNTFINLVLIKQSGEIARNYDHSVRGDMDDIVKSKERVNYKNIFSKYIEGGLILVEGRPGSGKTTLVHKIARDWACEGDILTNAKLVFLVPLRVLDHEIVGHTLSDLLKSIFWDKSDLESVCSKIKELNGKGVCFILDGLDEYKQRDSKSSVVHALLYKQYIPDAMVIVASRPVATAGLRRDCVITKHIEVIGFSKDQIYEYIERFPFVHSAKSEMSAKDKLKTYLKVHQNIQHMCYLPVHAAMVCLLHQYSEHVPHTETKIYEEFTRLILLRCLSRSDANAQLPSLSSLCGQQAEWFKKICHLAFDMTIQSKQVVHQRDTEVPLSPDCSHGDECGLGLVTIDHTVAMFGLTDTHTFLHLTLQEYLAAYHIASREEDEQRKLLHEHRMKSHMSNVLVFYCGMTHFTEDDARLLVVYSSYSLFRSSSNRLHSAFESQQRVVCDRVVKGDGVIVIQCCYLTLVDISSMVYVMSNISSLIQHLEITECHMNADKLKYFFESFASCKYSTLNRSDMLCKLALLNYLKLTSNSLGVEGVVVLVSGLNDANVHLRLLELANNDIDGEGARVVLDDLNCRQDIEVLVLCDNGIEGAVWGGLKYWTNLKTLDVSWNTIDVPSFLDGVVGTSQNCIGQPCINLEILNVCECEMDETKALIDGLKLCTGLHELNLNGNKVDKEGVVELCDGLKCWHELKELHMGDVGIGGDSVVVLAKGLQICKALEEINLSKNGIGPNGAIILANGLRNCSALRVIDLQINKIGSKGALALAEKLKSWPNLENLYLRNNGIETETMIRLGTLSSVFEKIVRIVSGDNLPTKGQFHTLFPHTDEEL